MNILRGIWRDAWRVPDRRSVSEWAEEYIPYVPYSPTPGRFRIENSPQIREVMAAIVDPNVRLVSVVAAVQSGKTLGPEIALCYIISELPGPTLWLDQTNEDAKDESESRLQRLFEVCEPVRRLLPHGVDRHKKRNHTIHFLNGMPLWVLGAHCRTNLQRRSIRWLIGDETWRWPPGHMAEAEARVTAFGWLGKCVFLSQGCEENDDTHQKFLTTDQREWMFACLECGYRQAFRWEAVEWSQLARDEHGEWDYKEVRRTTVLRCESCNYDHEDCDRVRRALAATGQFVRQCPQASAECVGFHWNALCMMSWGVLAESYLRAKAAARRGDVSLLRQFYQKRLGLPWKEFVEDFRLEITCASYRKGEEWTETAGIDVCGRIVATPFDAAVRVIARLMILTVDVQLDHFYAVVRAWSACGSSRLIWNDRLLSWEDVEALQKRFDIFRQLVFVDAGHATYDVYRECSLRGWVALIGDRRLMYSHRTRQGELIQRFYSPRRKVALSHLRHCFVHYWSNLSIKDVLARLRGNHEGGATWEVPSDIDDVYLAQMESEHRVQQNGGWMWKQIGSRPNHYFDCEAMQVAAAAMLKIIGREAMEAVVDK